jgi:diketogulonate reductase-like aldo/keto reductase
MCTPAVNWPQELLQYCRKHGIQLVAYSPFGKGRLLRDPNILKVAAKYKKTAAQILVRWPLQVRFRTHGEPAACSFSPEVTSRSKMWW